MKKKSFTPLAWQPFQSGRILRKRNFEIVVSIVVIVFCLRPWIMLKRACAPWKRNNQWSHQSKPWTSRLVIFSYGEFISVRRDTPSTEHGTPIFVVYMKCTFICTKLSFANIHIKKSIHSCLISSLFIYSGLQKCIICTAYASVLLSAHGKLDFMFPIS